MSKHEWAIARDRDRLAFKRVQAFVCAYRKDEPIELIKEDIALLQQLINAASNLISEQERLY